MIASSRTPQSTDRFAMCLNLRSRVLEGSVWYPANVAIDGRTHQPEAKVY